MITWDERKGVRGVRGVRGVNVNGGADGYKCEKSEAPAETESRARTQQLTTTRRGERSGCSPNVRIDETWRKVKGQRRGVRTNDSRRGVRS